MSWSASSVTANTGSTAPTDQGQSGNKKDSTLASFYSSITLPSTGSHLLGGVLADDKDDRRPSTPRNASPAQIGDFDELEGNNEDLLVFGYECKIFRDDDRAQWVEDEKHLIPWMGNRGLLIDRYDCRGALMDISRYESGQVSLYQDENIPAGILSSAQNPDDAASVGRNLDETLLERELDEERYRDLNEDEDYDDEAYNRDKKLRSSSNGMKTEKSGTSDPRHYASFQYNYNEKNHETCIGPEPKRLHDEDSPYVKPVGLYIPEEISLPKTMKNHAIIVKTAKFIASQGNQMEIILKTKQAGNRLFDFLTHSGKLNPYYKFMVHAIRTGIYRPPDEDSNDVNNSSSSVHDCSGGEDDADHTYLHPSLFRTSNTATSIGDTAIPTIASSSSLGSSSSRHNTYTMLVSKIKGTESPDPTQTGYSSNNVQVPPATGAVPPDPNHASNLLSNYGYNIPPVLPVPAPSNDTHRTQKQLPSTQDQLIIEKMASYVIKNGASFEAVAKNKGDPRFGFLNSDHDYHWYYLNCKERFKAESTAVVASSNFVNYSEKSAAVTIPAMTSGSSISSSTVKKSVAMELAELRRKGGLVSKKSGEVLGKEKNGGNGSSTTGTTPTESVFSQAGLVKDKDKPVIRFASTLSLNALTSGTLASSESLQSDKKIQTSIKTKESGRRNSSPQRLSRSPIRVDSDNDSEDCTNPFDDTRIGNTPPISDDEEQVKRRMERKRKAEIFLQKLKMKSAAGIGTDTSKNQDTTSSSAPKISKEAPPAISSTSLGDLLNRRLLADNMDKMAPTPVVQNMMTETRIDNGGSDDEIKSTSSSPSRHSHKSRFHKSSKKRRSYSISSTASSASESSAHYSKKKSSKRKHRKKKKKHEKSSKISSRKSKRRK